MSLTLQQQQALRASIVADSMFDGWLTDPDPSTRVANAEAIAALYNGPANPPFIVWKTSVTRKEILQNGFDWTRLDNLSVGKARIWSDIFVGGEIDPSKANVRTGIEAVWVGTAPDLAVRAAVYVHCKRSATRFERLLATGTGSDASPGTMTYEGGITGDDVLLAWEFGG